MCEIKVRLWDGERYFYQDEDSFGFAPDESSFSITIQASQKAQEEGFVLELYTGKKDCNGVEIYQNDIIKGFGMEAKVFWDEDEAGWIATNSHEYIRPSLWPDCQVIDDIHHAAAVSNPKAR